MPTTLPDPARCAKPRSWPSYTRLVRFFAVFLYLLLLSWNVSALETDFVSLAPVHAADAYSPMEPAQLP
jgi:hypothetical protein